MNAEAIATNEALRRIAAEPLLQGLPSAAPAARNADRERMIAEAAYYRAERRGFAPGAEVDDWLAAEAEIEALLRAAT